MDIEKESKNIEDLEYKYLKKYWYFLKFVEDEIIKGINSKDDIKNHWQDKYGGKDGGISSFSVGSERIVYALLNGKIAGQPNSAPVSSDLFFEVDDAFIHIDLKTVLTKGGNNEKFNDNIGDFNTSIFIGENQNSYKGVIEIKKSKQIERREYTPNLPTCYVKQNGVKKTTLTYFITILNNEASSETELISIMCMPNGNLEHHYKSRPLKAGKNPGKVRFNFKEVSNFELLNDRPERVMVVYKNPNMNKWVEKKLEWYLGINKL